MSALSLIHAGYDEYWDQIDRFTRNQTAQAQFLDPSEWVRSKARSGRFTDKEQWVYEGWPNDLPRLPYDDYENVVDRCVGGFLWTSADEHLFIPGAVMLCCCAHGVRSYHLVWREAVTEDIGGIRVNLHFNVENELAEIIAFEPYCGRTTVVPKKNAELSVRVPEFALGEGVSAFADGKPVDVRVDGRYAAFGPVIAGHEYTIEYDLHERETAEVQHYFKNRDLSAAEEQIAFTAKWTGNTVVSIEPSSREEKAIYRTRTIAPNDAEDRDGSIPTRDISYFLSAKNIRW